MKESMEEGENDDNAKPQDERDNNNAKKLHKTNTQQSNNHYDNKRKTAK